MKVEIEMSEIDFLKENLRRAREENNRLEDKLKSLDEKILKAQAKDLAVRMLNNYMACVFDKLGFGDTNTECVNMQISEWELGESWWNSKRVQIEIGANVTNKFRRAFLNILTLPKEVAKEEIIDYKK